MKAFVVDENVPIVANDNARPIKLAAQASQDCRLACVQELRKAVKSGLIIIDTVGEVIEKYRSHLQYKGQPGIGDAFYKHVVDHKFNRKRVRQIAVPTDAERGFSHFPETASLAAFHHDDRIFVALALASPEEPTILNAVDSDYTEHKAALTEAGVKVREICPDCIRVNRVPVR